MSGYLEQVGSAYQRALDREALFEGLARRSRSADRRRKLRVLQQLDIASRTMLGAMLANGVAPQHPSAGIARRVRALADRRWIEFVDRLCRELDPQVHRLEHLERSAPAADQKQLAYVTAHLIALQSFARLELVGRGRESLLPAERLIAHRAEPLPLGVAAG